MKYLINDSEILRTNVKKISANNHFIKDIEQVLLAKDINKISNDLNTEQDISLNSLSRLWMNLKSIARYKVGSLISSYKIKFI